MKIDFNELPNANLIPGAIYKKGSATNLSGEPISKLFKLNGFRGIGNQSGIRRGLVEREGNDEIAFMVLVHNKQNDQWPNHYNIYDSVLTYYGDNKEPGNPYLNTKQRGNQTFEEIFKQSYGTPHERFKVPPIFYFEQVEDKSAVKFIGLALPFVKNRMKNETLKLKSFTTESGSYENYVAQFTVVKSEVIDRKWLYDLKRANKINSVYQPDIWGEYLAMGEKLNVKSDKEPPAEVKDPNQGNEELEHEGMYLKSFRKTQSIFRKILIKNRLGKCEICEINNEKVLVASHIIPWHVSQDSEKIDVNNGLLLCANHDRLFDQGFITFDDSGRIQISAGISMGDYDALNINVSLMINMSEEMKSFMFHHRTRIFQI